MRVVKEKSLLVNPARCSKHPASGACVRMVSPRKRAVEPLFAATVDKPCVFDSAKLGVPFAFSERYLKYPMSLFKQSDEAAVVFDKFSFGRLDHCKFQAAQVLVIRQSTDFQSVSVVAPNDSRFGIKHLQYTESFSCLP